MALGIGQQIKGVVQRARSYWADLTDASGKRSQHDREEKEDAVHQRYGGVSAQGERDADTLFRERQEESQDRGLPDAVMGNPAARAARGQATQPGGQSRRNNPVQAGAPQMQAGQANAPAQARGAGQTSRQYTQQGGSGIQKSLGDQLGRDSGTNAPGAAAPGATAAGTTAPGASRGRNPGQRR